MTQINIRQDKPEDTLGITTAHVRSWQHAYKGIVPQEYLDNMSIEERMEKWRKFKKENLNPKMKRLVVEKNASIAGFSAFGPVRDKSFNPEITGEVYAIYMHPNHYGQGLGGALMTETLNDLRKQNYQDCIVWSLKDNESAIKFYQRCGFEIVEGKKDFFDVAGIKLEETCLKIKL